MYKTETCAPRKAQDTANREAFDGWRLVSVVAVDATSKVMLFFERPWDPSGDRELIRK